MAPILTLRLEPPHNGEFYTLEDTVSGELLLELDKSIEVREIVVNLVGNSEATVRPGEHYKNGTRTSLQMPLNDERSFHKLVDSEISVFPPENVRSAIKGSSRAAFKLEQGSYNFGFTFTFPEVPQCSATHAKNLLTYTKSLSHVSLPPSFNHELSNQEIFDLDVFFYSLGKVEYFVESTLYSGNDESWFKTSRNYCSPKTTIELMPSNLAQEELQDILQNEGSAPLEVFDSKFDVMFDNYDMKLWAEVRSKQLRSVYRLDYLFLPGCDKFDQVYILMSSPLPKTADLRVVGVDLNLVEFTTYLAGGRSNANYNTLRLARSKSELKVDLSRSITETDGTTECQIELGTLSPLDQVRFNEEDYKYRGNRLYSLTSCNIRRVFKFQLILHMLLDDKNHFQFEILTDLVNVFCESVTVETHPPAYAEDEQLPTYKGK
ncbi:LADA_0C03202g1_1 [Lachancea dasiensis]|uniref:LADA_0C03202g1_1 n=1 Tax=Lachancea dasiensis TaxID=1072105 RepID=A0A1G4IYE0_9SACH|nr:LADA_0C03202g1_1 [Lachancea dasiensis]